MNFSDNDYIVINDVINGKEVDKDILADVKQKLEYNVELINLRREFMNKAEELDKKYTKENK